MYIYMCVCVCYLLRRYQPEQSPVEVDLLLQILRRKERPFARSASRLHRRKSDVQDGALNVGVVLDVEHEHRFPRGGEHGGDALQEEAEQRREEALLGHVLQAHRDAVGQHVVGDDGDAQRAEGDGAVDAIWKDTESRLFRHVDTELNLNVCVYFFHLFPDSYHLTLKDM